MNRAASSGQQHRWRQTPTARRLRGVREPEPVHAGTRALDPAACSAPEKRPMAARRKSGQTTRGTFGCVLRPERSRSGQAWGRPILPSGEHVSAGEWPSCRRDSRDESSFSTTTGRSSDLRCCVTCINTQFTRLRAALGPQGAERNKVPEPWEEFEFSPSPGRCRRPTWRSRPCCERRSWSAGSGRGSWRSSGR